MKRFWIIKGLKFVAFATVFIIAGGYLVMSLWNWLIPSIFTGSIGFMQALGILLLMRILVGGFGRGRGWGGHHGGSTHWKQRMEERMADMTPEQKDAFKLQMQERWGSRCGPRKEKNRTETV